MKRLILLTAMLASAAAAQQPPQSTGKVVGDIATTPLQDFNIKQRKIPELLEAAAADPYARTGLTNCRIIGVRIGELNEVLGPDFDSVAEQTGTREGRLAAGVARGVVQGLIPFRGAIREVSGAAGAQRRYDAAVDAGIARRGFMRGLARARGCRG